MLQRAIRVLFFSTCILTLTLAGCMHKKQYGLIYQGSDGKYYTRSYNPHSQTTNRHDDGGQDFYWWMYMGDKSPISANGSSVARSSSTGTGNWARASAPPTGLTSTSKVVEEEDGKPTEEVEEETPTTDENAVSEQTTETEAENAESASSETAEGTSESSADSSASDSSSGGDAGDAGGGGDSGGGVD